MSRRVALQHILRPGRKAVHEVLIEIKAWNEGYAPGKKSERVFTKLQQFMDQFEQGSPSPKDAVIVFLAYWELIKDMIGSLKAQEKATGVASLSNVAGEGDEEGEEKEEDGNKVDFTNFDWVGLLCRAYVLNQLEESTLPISMSQSQPSQSDISVSSSSLSSSPHAAANIREKDISRMLQSLDSLRKCKSFLSANEFEERLQLMTAPLSRYMEQVRKSKVVAIDEEAFRQLDASNDKDYLYFKAGSAISALAKAMRYPVEVETTAFEILHRVACGEYILAEAEVTIAGLTALYLASKCWSDTFRTAGMKDLITKGYLPELHPTHSLKIPCRAAQGEGDAAKKMETFIADVRKRCATFEVKCLAAIGYNFNFEEISLTLKGGMIDKCSKTFKVSETSQKRAKEVIGHASFKFSHLCFVEDRTVLAIAALSIVRADARDRTARASADTLGESSDSGVHLDEEEVASMAGRANVDVSLVCRTATTMHKYKTEVLTAMKARYDREEQDREASGEMLEEPEQAHAPPSARSYASAVKEGGAPQLIVPQRGNLSRSSSLVTDLPSASKRHSQLEQSQESGQKRQRMADGGDEGAEFQAAINLLHTARGKVNKSSLANDKGSVIARTYISARNAVMTKWGNVPEALPSHPRGAKRLSMAQIQKEQIKIAESQAKLRKNPRDKAMEAYTALLVDNLRSWGCEPLPETGNSRAPLRDTNRRSNGNGSGRISREKRERGTDSSADTGILSRLGVGEPWERRDPQGGAGSKRRRS